MSNGPRNAAFEVAITPKTMAYDAQVLKWRAELYTSQAAQLKSDQLKRIRKNIFIVLVTAGALIDVIVTNGYIADGNKLTKFPAIFIRNA